MEVDWIISFIRKRSTVLCYLSSKQNVFDCETKKNECRWSRPARTSGSFKYYKLVDHNSVVCNCFVISIRIRVTTFVSFRLISRSFHVKSTWTCKTFVRYVSSEIWLWPFYITALTASKNITYGFFSHNANQITMMTTSSEAWSRVVSSDHYRDC